MAKKKDLENLEEIRPFLSNHSSATADRQSIQRRPTRCAPRKSRRDVLSRFPKRNDARWKLQAVFTTDWARLALFCKSNRVVATGSMS